MTTDVETRLRHLAGRIKREHAASVRCHRQALKHAIKAGHYLIDAKQLCGHGKFMKWVKDETEIPHRTATDYMLFAENEDFIKSKLADFANLTMSAARAEIHAKLARTTLPEKIDPATYKAAVPETAFETTTTVWNLADHELRCFDKFFRQFTGERAYTDAPPAKPGEINIASRFGAALTEMTIERWIKMVDQPVERVFDPFAGDVERGAVFALNGYDYHGIEIREEAVTKSRRLLKHHGLPGTYYHGDAADLSKLLPKDLMFDFVLTSPPYYDLEKYEAGDGDLSAARTYKDFDRHMGTIAKAIYPVMTPGAFVCIKVGDVREKDGELIDLRGDTINNYKAAGFRYHESIILPKAPGSAARRARKAWRGHKLVRTHQYLLVFQKPGP